MARNGSGTYSNPYPNFVSGTVISSTEVDANNSAIATALTQSIAVDGQSTVTANLPLNSKKLTGLAAGTAAADSISLGQAQAEAFVWCGTAGGSANAITLAPSPAITSYAAGQRFVWMASSTVNTGATTVAISGLGAIALQDNGAALVAGNHAASKMFMGILNTTSTVQIMQVQSSGTDPLIVSSLTVSGTATIGGILSVDDTTTSTSGTTGSIHTDGGLGVAGTAFVAGAAKIVGVTTHGGDVLSDTDSTDSIGSSAVRWAGTWTDAINGVTSPTAQYTSAEETKLAGIEASADVTDATNVASALANGVAALTSGEVTQLANIGTAAISAAEWGYVAASTQAYDSADHTKLNGIEALADVTDATNVLAGLVGQEAVATGFTGTLDGVLGGGTPAAATVTTLTASGDLTANNFAGRNRIINGDFAIWQRGTSFSPAANAQVYTVDRFFMNRNGVSEWTVARQGNSAQYSCRVQRNASTTSTQAMRVRQVLESANCVGTVGETVTFSCEIKVGANFSAASGYVTLTIVTGTGNDQSSTTMATGFTGAATASSNTVPTTSFVKYSVTSAVLGATASQLGVLIEATPVGTAGADDWYEIRNLQLEVGSTATEFEVGSVGNTLAKCQRYYQRHSSLHSCWSYNTTTIRCSVAYSPQLRAAGTLSLIDTTPSISDGVAGFTGSSSAITNGAASVNGQIFKIDGFSGLTAWHGFGENQATDIWAVSAEL